MKNHSKSVNGALDFRYGWILSLLGRKRPKGLVGGADLADRCSDAIVTYLLRVVPLSSDVRATMSARLEERWGPRAEAAAEDGLAASLSGLFDGKRVTDAVHTDSPSGPGCAVVREFDV